MRNGRSCAVDVHYQIIIQRTLVNQPPLVISPHEIQPFCELSPFDVCLRLTQFSQNLLLFSLRFGQENNYRIANFATHLESKDGTLCKHYEDELANDISRCEQQLKGFDQQLFCQRQLFDEEFHGLICFCYHDWHHICHEFPHKFFYGCLLRPWLPQSISSKRHGSIYNVYESG